MPGRRPNNNIYIKEKKRWKLKEKMNFFGKYSKPAKTATRSSEFHPADLSWGVEPANPFCFSKKLCWAGSTRICFRPHESPYAQLSAIKTNFFPEKIGLSLHCPNFGGKCCCVKRILVRKKMLCIDSIHNILMILVWSSGRAATSGLPPPRATALWLAASGAQWLQC